MQKAGTEWSASRIAVICACLLLALSVFAWGLHAKLSLYDAQVGPPAASAAKLLAPQKTGRDLVAQTATPAFPDLRLVSLALFSAVLVLPLFWVRWLRPEIVRGPAQDAPWRTPLFSRPPPMAAVAR